MNISSNNYLRKHYCFRLFFQTMLIAVMILVGCSNENKPKQDESIHITLEAGEDVNPNEDGIANPVRVLVYQLYRRDLFDAADFLSLSEGQDPELAQQAQVILDTIIQPGEKKEQDIAINSNAMAIAVVTAYRDISHSAWKQVVVMPAKPALRWYQHLYPWPEEKWQPHFVIRLGRLATTIKSME